LSGKKLEEKDLLYLIDLCCLARDKEKSKYDPLLTLY